MKFFLTWLLTSVSLFLTAYIVPGIEITGFTAAAVAAVILGLVNAIIKPILVLFTLPLTIITLGLFLLVVNAISLGIVGYFTPGFSIDGFLPAIIGSIVLSIVSGFLNGQFKEEN